MQEKTKKTSLVLIALLVIAGIFLVSGLVIKNSMKNLPAAKSPVVKNDNSVVVKSPETATQPKNYTDTSRSIEAKIAAGTATEQDHIDLGVAYYNLKEYAKAEATYRDIVAKNPGNFLVYSYLANTLRDEGKFDEAEQNYRKSTEIDPTFINSYTSLASMLYVTENNKKDQAIAVLKDGLSKNPDDATLQRLLELYQQ